MANPSNVDASVEGVTTRAGTAAAGGWSLHRGLVVLGFLAALAAFLAVTRADPAVMASPQFVPFTAIFVVAAILTAVVAVRETPGRLLAAAVAVSVPGILVLGLFGGVASLASPLGEGPFVLYHLLLLSLLLALPAGVQGFRALRQGASLPRFRRGLATRHGLAAAIVAAVTLTAAGVGAIAAGEAADLTDGSTAYDFAPDATVEVAAEGFEFPAQPLRFRAGEITEVVVENRDAAFHTFTYAVDGQRYNHDVPAGATVTFLVRFDAPGTVQYWCEPHSDGPDGQRTGMVGTIEVT